MIICSGSANTPRGTRIRVAARLSQAGTISTHDGRRIRRTSFAGVEFDEAAIIAEAIQRLSNTQMRRSGSRRRGQVLDTIHEMRGLPHRRYYERTDHLSSAVFYYKSVRENQRNTIAAARDWRLELLGALRRRRRRERFGYAMNEVDDAANAHQSNHGAVLFSVVTTVWSDVIFDEATVFDRYSDGPRGMFQSKEFRRELSSADRIPHQADRVDTRIGWPGNSRCSSDRVLKVENQISGMTSRPTCREIGSTVVVRFRLQDLQR